MIKKQPDNKIYMIGNAHIDPAWLWRWQEGYSEIKATFQSALERMEEFPEFIFTCAGASYYRWIEENEYEMFEKIKQRIDEGRWVIAGGWWNQPDCNIPCGESFVRQGLYSQNYFMSRFNKIAKTGYNVDSFGHNGMLPQILKKSGMENYVFMRPDDTEKGIPSNPFLWEGTDDSRVLTYRIPFSYGNYWDGDFNALEEKIYKTCELKDGTQTSQMCFYGVGNHGGGPTIANINLIKDISEKNGTEELVFSSPDDYFKDQKNKDAKLPIVKGDLQYHSVGCYSAYSDIKMMNRKAEHRLIGAEKASAMSKILCGYKWGSDDIKKAWENVLFNQFHDILGGCCIKEAYEDSKELYGEALSISGRILNASLQKISWNIDTSNGRKPELNKEKHWMLWETEDKGVPLVVFNLHSWDITATIRINKSIKCITDESGNNYESQTVRGPQTNKDDKYDTIFIGSIPAMGYRVYWISSESGKSQAEQTQPLSSAENKIENEKVILEIDKKTGWIKSFIDKEYNANVFDGYGAVPIVIDESAADTWAHNIRKFDDIVGCFNDTAIKLIEKGPLRYVIRVKNKYNNSILQQDFILYKGKKEIEVNVKLDWREKHKMLKLSFSANLKNIQALCEIPYGIIKRETEGNENSCQQWTAVVGSRDAEAADKYGVALANSGKYSFDVSENDMRMTVVRSPIFADHFGERDDMCEFMDQGIHEFKYLILPFKGDICDSNIVKKAYELNMPLVSVIETYHKGALPLSFEGIRISSDNIIASALKPAEDGKGYILRCYETYGIKTKTKIEIGAINRNFDANFDAFEIKTFRIPEDSSLEVMETNLIEMDGV